MRLALLVGLLLVGTCARADFLGVYTGAGYWNANFSGDVIAGISLEDELNIDRSGSSYIYIAFEHPIPLVPNIKVAHTTLKDSATGTIDQSFTFNGDVFTANQTVTSEVDLTHTDVTLYYELLDIGMDLDVGITGRYFQGGVAVNSSREDISVLIPMFYGRAKFALPLTGAYFGGDINYANYSGNQIADYVIAVGWEAENFILPEVGIEAGYRSFRVDAGADDLDIAIDAQVNGIFVNLTAHF
ncbi:MAG: outer membrane protein [Candidatus Pseudothioglobus sp.]|jgi:outer membrane protein